MSVNRLHHVQMKGDFVLQINRSQSAGFHSPFDLACASAVEIPHSIGTLPTFGDVAGIESDNDILAEMLLYKMEVEEEEIERLRKVLSIGTFVFTTIPSEMHEVVPSVKT